jgi:hypothetical protein
VFEGDDVIFIEVVAKRVNMIGAVLELDDDAIEDVLEKGVAKKLRQLHTNIVAYRAGEIFADRERPAGQRLFAMIVTPVPYPHSYLMMEYIPRLIAEERLLPDIAAIVMADIVMADVEEIELLEDGVPLGLRLGKLLAGCGNR